MTVVMLAALLAPSRSSGVSEGAPAVYSPLVVESARAVGMGLVTVIATDGPTATRWNPGFLAFCEDYEALGTTGEATPFIADTYIRTIALTGPMPTRSGRLKGGLSFRRYSLGTRDLLDYGSTSSFDHAYAAALAVPFNSWLGGGMTFEYVWSHLSDPIPELNITSGAAGALSASTGVAARRTMTFRSESEDGNRLLVTPLAGVSLLHVGEKLHYENDMSTDLFRQLHCGFGIEVASRPRDRVSLGDPRQFRVFEFATGVETVFPAVEWSQISQKKMLLLYGAELTLFQFLSGRIGFIDDDEGGIRNNTYGTGFRILDVKGVSGRIDWASQPFGGGADYRAGRWAVALAWAGRRASEATGPR